MPFRLPKKLFVGYKYLKKSRLVLKNATDSEALSYFQNILNEAQPQTPEEKGLYNFWRGFYNVNRRKVLSLIKSERDYEPLLLWTESRAIVNSLGLKGVVYIKWTQENSYEVTKFVSSENKTNATNRHPVLELYTNQNEKTLEQDTGSVSTELQTSGNNSHTNGVWDNNNKKNWSELEDREDD